MPRTIWNSDDRRALLARLDRLSAGSRPQWGRFDAPRMLAHVTDALRTATGEVRCAPRRSPLRYPPINSLVMFHVPWPKGSPTAPELLARAPAGWPEETALLRAAIEAFVTRAPGGAWPDHAAFGRLSGEQWGRLMHRHIDHHWKQFGV